MGRLWKVLFDSKHYLKVLECSRIMSCYSVSFFIPQVIWLYVQEVLTSTICSFLFFHCLKINRNGAGEVISEFWALDILAEDLLFIPSTLLWFSTACNASSRRSEALIWPLQAPGMHTYIAMKIKHSNT